MNFNPNGSTPMPFVPCIVGILQSMVVPMGSGTRACWTLP